jgi:hypothetical protein
VFRQAERGAAPQQILDPKGPAALLPAGSCRIELPE